MTRYSREFAETNRGGVLPNDLQKLGDVLSEDVAVLADGFPVVFLPLAYLGTGSLHEHGLARLRSMEASFFSLIASFFWSPRTLSWMFFMTLPFSLREWGT